MTESMYVRGWILKNCHNCRYYNQNGKCTHPRYGQVINLFGVNKDEPCPFHEYKEEDNGIYEHGGAE